MIRKKQTSPSKVSGSNDTASGIHLAIIRVSKKNYIPPEVILRVRITDYIFTAEVPASIFEKLEKDQQVESVALNQHLDSDD